MIRAILFDNFWTKITALILAVLLWAYLYLESTETKIRDVPLELEYNREQFVLINAGEIPTLIRVELTARKGLLDSINLTRIRCVHHVSSGRVGNFEEALERDSFMDVPTGVQITVIPTNKIQIKMDAWEYRRVKITSQDSFKGTPSMGYEVPKTSIQIVPSEIMIKVPKEQADRIPMDSELQVEPVDISGMRGMVSRTASLRKPEGVTHLQYTGEIKIHVPLEPIPDAREVVLDVYQILPANFPYDLELEPQRVKVKLEGPKSVLDEIKDVSKIMIVFFVWDRPVADVRPGDKLKLPVIVHLLDKNYDRILTITPMSDAVERVVQVKVKERSLPPR